MKIKISINTFEKVKKFIDIISKYSQEATLVSGRYVINAKSIMGIFSVDISKDMELMLEGKDETENKKMLTLLKEFIVN